MMEHHDASPQPQDQDYKIVFEKLEEVKASHPELITAIETAKINDSINQIKQIVESLAETTPVTFFTRA